MQTGGPHNLLGLSDPHQTCEIPVTLSLLKGAAPLLPSPPPPKPKLSRKFKRNGTAAAGRAVGRKVRSSNPHQPKAHKVEKLVGRPMETNAIVNGKSCACLIDTGSQVTTLPISFYKSKLQNIELYNLDESLRVEAANGQPVPYTGYIEVDIELPGSLPSDAKMVVPILIVNDTTYNKRVPLTIGTNVILTCMEQGQASQGSEYVHSRDINPTWKAAYNCLSNSVHVTSDRGGKVGTLRLKGSKAVCVPANEMLVVECELVSSPIHFDCNLLVETTSKQQLSR